MSGTRYQREYWKRNLTAVATLLAIWFTVSYGFGIFFVEPLSRTRAVVLSRKRGRSRSRLGRSILVQADSPALRQMCREAGSPLARAEPRRLAEETRP